jgi:hypothetical protein
VIFFCKNRSTLLIFCDWNIIIYYILWLCSPARGFLITHNDAPHLVGPLWTSDQLVAKTSTWQHNTHNRQTSMPPVGFEPTKAVSERPQTYASDRAVTGPGDWNINVAIYPKLIFTLNALRFKRNKIVQQGQGTILYCPVLKCVYLHLANKFLQYNT